ncbi:MAG: hypothetical protein F6K55_06265 [Moorea sp. SIO4A3]|nr:hypothetical protein [Moorena sp. SIO4A3]
MEWASCVELASCQFPAYCRTGILPVSCLLWNDFVSRTGILPVSCLLWNGHLV